MTTGYNKREDNETTKYNHRLDCAVKGVQRSQCMIAMICEGREETIFCLSIQFFNGRETVELP